MAVNDRELRITLRALIGDFVNPLKTARSEIKAFGEDVNETFEHMEERAERMPRVFKDLLEAFIGAEIVEQLKKIAEGANAANDSLEIAANTAKNFGKAFDADVMESWLKKLANSAQGGGFAIDKLRDSTQQLATTGASQAQIQRLLVDSVALAATKHIDLAEATHMVVEAATGHVEMLGRYGIAVKDAAGETLSFSQVMANLEAETMGNAEKRAEGLEGAFGRLATAANGLVTGPFGQTMVTIFVNGANAVTRMINAVAALPPPLLELAASGLAALAALSALGLMLPAVKLGFELLFGGIGLVRDILDLSLKSILFFVGGLRDLVTWVQLARDAFIGMSIAEWIAEAPLLAILGVIAALVGVIVEAVRGFKDLATVWGWIKQIFGGDAKLAQIKPPKTDLDGLGGVPPNQQKAINDWLDAQKAAILRAVDVATQATAEAQARLEAATAKLQELRDKRDPTKPLTRGNVAEEQRLANAELEREEQLRAAVADQRQAELTAARQLNALAAAVPGNDKDRVQHATELRAEAEKHVLAAIKLDTTYDKMGGTIAKLVQEIAKIPRALQEQMARFGEIAADTMRKSFGIGNEAAAHHDRSDYERSIVRPANGPEDAARRKVGAAQFDYTEAHNAVNLAKLDEEAAKTAQQLAYLRAATQDAVTAAQTRADADLAVQQAAANVSKALDDLRLAGAKLTEAKQEEHASTLKTIEDKTLGKVPGVSVGATGNLGFSFGSFLADAISQSHLFANVMQLVNEIMFVFQQIITAIEPIMDSLLTVIAYVVNGFISLWNIIARMISILGIHLAQLNYINTVFSTASAQMVTFTHDIPTLNELASGNIAPLTTNPTNNPWSILHQDLVTNDQHQDTWFTNLIKAVGALLLIDFLTGGKFLSGLGSLIPGLGNIFQGVGKDLGAVFQNVGQFFVNGWNGLQNWMTAHLGNVGAGIADIAGGTALLFTNDKGVAGWLEKILGVLLIIQGILNVTGGGSALGAISKLFNSGTGTGAAGALGAGTGSLGLGSLTSIGSGVPTGLSSDSYGVISATSTGPGIAGDPTGALYTLGGTGSNLPSLSDILGTGGAGTDAFGNNVVGSAVSPDESAIAAGNSGSGAGAAGSSAIGKIGANIGAGIVGGILGGLANSALGGNSQDSQIGSTVLGAVGSIFGPLGTGVGSFVGAIVGGLFGPHYNQTNNPDMYANDGYAQGIANWQGGAYTQANGSVSEDTGVSSALGGLTEQQFIQKFIQSNPTLANQILGSSMTSLFSGDSSVKTLHQGTLTLGNGQQVNWETFLSDISSAMTTIGQYAQQGQQSPGAAGTTTSSSTTNQPITNNITIGNVNGYTDITQLGADLANSQIRTLQSRLYSVARTAQ